MPGEVPGESAAHRRWLENVERRGVAPEVVAEVVCRHGIGPDDFAVLDRCEELLDPLGKSYFVLPLGLEREDARSAVLMTYVLNAGTDYGASAPVTDFAETSYGAGEVDRIAHRQRCNDWSLRWVVPLVHRHGARLVTTPHGMLMGLGGNRLRSLLSQRGGTTYGDVFLLNVDHVADPVDELRLTVGSGRVRRQRADGVTFAGRLPLDRLLHHEERHAQQWAVAGPLRFVATYAWEQVTRSNRTEVEAGLADGGYR